MTNTIKSRPCADFLRLMDLTEDPSYAQNLLAVIDSYKKRWIEINKEDLEKEIDIYM